jgi:hypothetical protein
LFNVVLQGLDGIVLDGLNMDMTVGELGDLRGLGGSQQQPGEFVDEFIHHPRGN